MQPPRQHRSSRLKDLLAKTSYMLQQIQTQMREAMRNLLRETMQKEKLSASDIDWLVRLCDELRNRLSALTPNRADLVDELHRSFDVSLLQQMLHNDALDSMEVLRLGDVILQRLSMLCAPCHDESVASLRKILSDTRDIGTLIYEANVILDDIESLASNAGR